MRWKFWARPEAKAADVTELTWAAIMGGNSSSSGVSVSVDRALQVSTVLACARVIAEGIAQLPCKLYRDLPDGGKQPAMEHPAYWLLYRRPNAWQTSFDFREMLSIHAVLTGSGYAYVNRVRGEVRELIPILPGMVTVEQSRDYSLAYSITDKDGRIGTVSADRIMHLRGPTWDGYRGMDIIRVAREAIGLSIATETSQAKLFGNGAQPGGILSTDQALTDVQVARLKTMVAEYAGRGRFGTMVLDGGLKFSSMSMTSIDAQQLESRKLQVEEICRFMRVFPQMVMHSDKTSTYASAEQFFLAHVVHSLGPWVERWEQTISRDVLTDEEARSGLFPKLAVQGLLRGDTKARVEYYTGMINIAAMNPNEVRSLEDMNPYYGGDTYRAQLNTADATLPPPSAEPAAPVEEPANAAV
jgi:HK97 family phage portal protein